MGFTCLEDNVQEVQRIIIVEIMLQLAHSATPSLIISSVKSVLQVKQIFIGVRDFKSIDVNLPFISFSNVCVISVTIITCDSMRFQSILCCRALQLSSQKALMLLKIYFLSLKGL